MKPPRRAAICWLKTERPWSRIELNGLNCDPEGTTVEACPILKMRFFGLIIVNRMFIKIIRIETIVLTGMINLTVKVEGTESPRIQIPNMQPATREQLTIEHPIVSIMSIFRLAPVVQMTLIILKTTITPAKGILLVK